MSKMDDTVLAIEERTGKSLDEMTDQDIMDQINLSIEPTEMEWREVELSRYTTDELVRELDRRDGASTNENS